jgi:hypothetical protein
MADNRDPKSNVRAPDDDLQCSERVPSADPPCNGGCTSAAALPLPVRSAPVAYTAAEEAQQLAAVVAVEPVGNTQPSR